VHAVARRRAGLEHQVLLEGGHRVLIDEGRAGGGTTSGPSPTQLLAASLASCTAITVELYAERKGWQLGSFAVSVEVGFEGPRPTKFAVSLQMGQSPPPEQARRLIEIARRCPVHQALAGATPVAVLDRIEPL
jgi:putative redox protein